MDLENTDNLVIELRGGELIRALRDVLVSCKFITPRDGATKAIINSLIKQLNYALENPGKAHAYAKPRVMPWMQKL